MPIFAKKKPSFESKRPAIADRKFISESVEEIIQRVKCDIADPELAWMFENCFPNTLDTTIEYQIIDGKPDTFVITGDIKAMWLRDSTAQIWPYLPLTLKDEKLKKLILGVINRQTRCILLDPYANAFYPEPRTGHWKNDHTEMKPGVHERKWEIDSLCYAVRLAHGYWKITGDTSGFDNNWKEAMKLVVKTFKQQQRKEHTGPYSFLRTTSKSADTMPGSGYGNPILPCGLISSAFRPSDDSCIFLFLIPSNHFAVASLDQLSEIFQTVLQDFEFASQCNQFADEVSNALDEYAVIEHLHYGLIMPFEVDGFGNRLFMDDANIPSLLALPYLGCCNLRNPIYQNTRTFVLSENNPWFFKGVYAEGIGGPHVGKDMIWPLAIIMRALTSDDQQEIIQCLSMLKATHADTGFIHETFHKDNPKHYTRSWFSWANSLFGELILKIHTEKPEIVKSRPSTFEKFA